MPGGRPAVSLPIFSCEVSSALRTAALKAAATRSSSMSLSSPSRLGSMVTRLTSCLQVMTTFTRPAPDSPLTSMVASSSCAFFRLSCICCACFIRPASCPLLNMVVSLVFGGWFDAARHDFRPKVPLHLLHERIVEDDLLRFLLPQGRGDRVAACGAVSDGAYLDREVDGMAGGVQRGAQALAAGRLVERFALHPQHPVAFVARDELRLQGELAHERGDGLALHELLHRGLPEIAIRRGHHGANA